MRAIGFKNFRKFTDFPMMKFAPITIFVGGNNAGKSTVVKGLLSLTDFLKSIPYGEIEIPYTARERQDVPLDAILKQKKKLLKEQKFYFNTNPYTHIGTFERAQNNVCGEETMTFKGATGNYVFAIEVSKGKEKELPYGFISKVRIVDLILNINMDFDLFADEAKIQMNPHDGSFSEIEYGMQKRYFENLKNPCSFSYTISDYWTPDSPSLLTSLMASFNMAITFTLIIPEMPVDEVADMPYSFRNSYLSPKVVEGISDDALEALKAVGLRSMSNAAYRAEREAYRYMRFDIPAMRYNFSRGFNIEYIYSHAVSQNVWYVAGATDYLSKTIHEFAPEQNVPYKHQFIKEWMKKFNIGEDFEIKSVGGEAFRVIITNFDNSKIDLADKGMGTIQLMVLLFRLAITLPTKRYRRPSHMMQQDRTPHIIIVEEPEQNIHPKLQSLLADLFYEMSTLGFRFIVETHSEYLVRKTQVIVKKLAEKTGTLSENPFKVYYFKSEDNSDVIEDETIENEFYRDMIYQEDGFFANDFDSGFYDQSSTLTRQIL